MEMGKKDELGESEIMMNTNFYGESCEGYAEVGMSTHLQVERIELYIEFVK